jgi:hypothetical protein
MNMIKMLSNILVICLFIMLIPFNVSYGQVADDVNSLELLKVIHCPTAGVLKQGQYQINLSAFGGGGAQGGVSMGLFNRFMFGVSFGGDGLIGYDEPEGNKFPGVQVKYRMIDETFGFPAITIGFDMQGNGRWYEEDSRYLFKSPGGFVAMSRNWVSDYGRFGIHLGANYNTIETDDQRSVDGFAGIDFSLNEQVALMMEYDLGFDDAADDGRFGDPSFGYLNAGVRLTFAQALVIQFDFIDLLNSSAETPGIGREIRIVYVETFTF